MVSALGARIVSHGSRIFGSIKGSAKSSMVWIKNAPRAAVDFSKEVLTDYATAFKNVGKYAAERPVRFGIYNTSIGTIIAMHAYNLQPKEYETRIMQNMQLLGELHPDRRNPQSEVYQRRLDTARQQRTLRIYSFGIATLIWIDDDHEDLSLFGAKHSTWYRWVKEIPDRFQEFSVFGYTPNLDKSMIDYDVADEW